MSVVSIASHPRFQRVDERPVRRREIEAIIGVGRSTIFEYLKLGMPHVKTRGQNLFYPTEVKQWLLAEGIWRYDGRGLLDLNEEENS